MITASGAQKLAHRKFQLRVDDILNELNNRIINASNLGYMHIFVDYRNQSEDVIAIVKKRLIANGYRIFDIEEDEPVCRKFKIVWIN